MLYYRRLPDVYKTPKPVFLTWRLHGSLPVGRHFCRGTLPSGKAFAAKDRLLDEARTGRRYLADPAVADMVVEAIFCNAEVLKHYEVHAL